MLVHCGEERSLQRRGEPLEKAHLRPLHWQRGTEEFHEDKSKFSLLPCSEALTFPNRSTASAEEKEDEEEEEVVKEDSFSVLPKSTMQKKKKTWRRKRFKTAMNEAE